ncbi:hypothetical protein [Terribacillus saccharophilus]|uniref:Helix-turn-helix domain-containing protein n=1 Tax=Terribacillus saccharophilus TaxID=361277 RepID=A0ABX4H0C4_9BACI|nr:hypothetical protein [Terribacillus saccharophilus]PAD35966.1 hypothetical protein CHH56_05945 [Terribacillus saccharophilus]PAD96984.1 hypothetical protein CHH50_06365 [Terribacillus saccharophilus]PAE00560.1 hypothetical protein CHH48_07270 [Terribacillus saccharophilus]
MSANESKLTGLQREAKRQKQAVLENGKYAPIPHRIYREVLPELKEKYDGQTARDCLTLYMYCHAYVNGLSDTAEYYWAYPTVKKIIEDTGLHKDRIKGLFDVLETEGLMITRKVPRNGHAKKMYMPLYESKETSQNPASGI